MMKIKTILLSSLAATMLFACGTEGEDQATTKGSDDDVKKEIKEDQKEVKKEENKLMVVMDAKSGSSAEGHINLEQKDNKVMMEVKVKGLAPGEHAIHIHENGDCSADDGTSAGGHWDPTGHDHGKWGEDAYHMGDIGNLIANDKGEVSFKFVTEKWCIGCEDKTMNIIGKSFIIHAGADDFKSQPSGAAGSRVACGVIEK